LRLKKGLPLSAEVITMRVWRPARSLGGLISLLLVPTVWILAVAAASKVLPISWFSFWFALGTLLLLFAGVVLLYWGVAFFTLRYVFDRNGLTLHWGGTRQVIPMNRILGIRRWADGEQVRERGLRWPGCHRGWGRSTELGAVEFYATAGRSTQLLICTEEGTFVLSPRRPDEFIEEMEVRRSLGITRQLSQERHSWWLLGWSLWRDRPVWMIGGLALLINLALFALLCYWYPILQETRPLLPLHYSEILEEGQVRIIPDIIGPAGDLFKLPAFALLLFGANLILGLLLHHKHRLLVVLLVVVALMTQVMFFLGAVYILYR
jgi:hypothetical protein